jgi:hypothetical protein
VLDLGIPSSRRMHEVLSAAIAQKRPSITARMWAYRAFVTPCMFEFRSRPVWVSRRP